MISYNRYGNIIFQKVALGYEVPFVQAGSSKNVLKHVFLHKYTKHLNKKEAGIIVGLDKNTGKTLWKKEIQTASGATNNSYVSRAAPTPIIDAHQITVLFEGGNWDKLVTMRLSDLSAA